MPLSALLLPGVFYVARDELRNADLLGEDYFQVWKDCFAKTGDSETMWRMVHFFEEQERLVWEDRFRVGGRPDDDLIAGMSNSEIEELRHLLEESPKFQKARGLEEGDGDR